MNSTLRRLRPLLISLVALLLTAGIAFAAKPTSPAAGLSVASQAAGKTVPVANGKANSGQDQDTETNEATKDTGTSDNCTTDPTNLTAEQLAAMNHGSIVCWAAQQPTPDGYANHGAWVSHWAKMGHKPDASSQGATHASATGNKKGAAGLAPTH